MPSLDTGRSKRDSPLSTSEQSYQRVQIATHHPELRNGNSYSSGKKCIEVICNFFFSSTSLHHTCTASTVSFQDDGASELSFTPLRAAALARRLITPSPSPTWQRFRNFKEAAHLVLDHNTVILRLLLAGCHLYVQLLHQPSGKVHYLIKTRVSSGCNAPIGSRRQ